MKTELEVYIETDYTHENKFEAARQKIEKAAFYTQSLFKVIRLANVNFESITDDGDAQDAEHYIEDLNNLCEIGSGLAFSVFREVSNFSLFKFTETENQTEVSEIENQKSYTGKPEIDNLAIQISSLLNHPKLPQELYDHLSDAITDFFNADIDQTEINEYHKSPEYLAKILDGYVDLSKADEE